VRYAAGGFRFEIPLEDIELAAGTYYQVADGSPPAKWELAARTGNDSKDAHLCWTEGQWKHPVRTDQATTPAPVAVTRLNPDARFVDIDGDMHEVSGDIVANHPEENWAMLMKCRLRFGING